MVTSWGKTVFTQITLSFLRCCLRHKNSAPKLQVSGLPPRGSQYPNGTRLEADGYYSYAILCLLQVTDLPPEVASTRMGSNLEQARLLSLSSLCSWISLKWPLHFCPSPVSAPGSHSSDRRTSVPLQSLLLDLTQVTAALLSLSCLCSWISLKWPPHFCSGSHSSLPCDRCTPVIPALLDLTRVDCCTPVPLQSVLLDLTNVTWHTIQQLSYLHMGKE